MRRPIPFLCTVVAVVLLVGLSACSGAGSRPDAGAAADFQHDLVFTMKLTVPASTELHQCQFVQVPPGADINVTGFAHQYTQGSHHFLLYQTTLTAIPSDLTGQYDCTLGSEPIMQHALSIIYGAQTPVGAAPFPAGVAVTLPAGTVLIMNTHYLNATSAPLETTVQVGLDTTTPDKVQIQGGFFIFYDPFIDVPAHASESSGGRCVVPEDVTVVSAFTHYHYRGTKMQVWLDPSPTTKSASPFFETSDWQHPADFSGPATWPKSSVIRFQCDYANTGNDEVFQGPNAQTSEMCVFAGLYYPKQMGKFETCEAYSVSGFGTAACLSTVSCLGACPAGDAPVHTATTVEVGPCWERCVASACDGAVDSALPLLSCAGSQCSAECAMSNSTTCSSCVAAKCATEFSACTSQTCTN
jgi:hypothetical protein